MFGASAGTIIFLAHFHQMNIHGALPPCSISHLHYITISTSLIGIFLHVLLVLCLFLVTLDVLRYFVEDGGFVTKALIGDELTI